MNIKILTPEFVVFDGDVNSVLLPGRNGDFHIKKDHAAIVASLISGKVRVYTNEIPEPYAGHFAKESEKESVFSFHVRSGVIEFNNNKGIILAE